MSEGTHEAGGAGPSHRYVEIGVALVIALIAIIGMVGSLRVGIGWGVEGPQAGFFPFYVCLLIFISCGVNLFQIFKTEDTGLFAQWAQIRQVMAVVLPTAVYVFMIPYSGIYVASALLIAFFMIWLGRYRWISAVPVAVIVPVLVFAMFEIWFLVPLPKGPLERFLGF